MKREAFLDVVRRAAAAGRTHRVHVQSEFPANTGYVGAGDDPAQCFADEVNAVGGFAELVANDAAAREALAALVDRYSPRSALCWQHPLLDRLGLADLLAERGTEMLTHAALAELDPSAARAKMLAADIGITSTTWAVAETGSLLVASTPGRERSASLLPPVHIAIVARDQIVPDLFDAFERLAVGGAENLPTNATFITGPSKTGDLELRLTTGVHGPGVWHVIVIA